MTGGERARNEIIGSLLTMAIVVLAMSLLGVVVFTQQANQLDEMAEPSAFETPVTETALTITHTGASGSGGQPTGRKPT